MSTMTPAEYRDARRNGAMIMMGYFMTVVGVAVYFIFFR